MPFDLTDTMQDIIHEQERLGARPIEMLDADTARSQPSPADAVISLVQKRSGSFDPPHVADVEDRTIPGPTPSGIPIRIYQPRLGLLTQVKEALSSSATPHPVIVYVHGGGWVIADLDDYDVAPRQLANLAHAIVVSIEYRKAPEDVFPAAHDDVLAATRWVFENAEELGGDSERIAIAGESAGGNMAASTCLEMIKAGERPPIFQLLVYPVTDLVDDDWASYAQARDVKPLNTAALAWFGKLAMPEGAADPRVSILRADEALLAQMPPAHVVLAEADPLRDQGRAFAHKLRALGVPATLREYEGVTHEFFGMGSLLPEAREALDMAAGELRRAFDAPVPTAV